MFAFLLATLAIPQGEVRASARFEDPAVPSSSLAVLRVELQVAPGWHVYHPDQDPADGVPVSVAVGGEGLRAVGPTRSLQDPVVREERVGGRAVRRLELAGSPVFLLPVWVEGPAGSTRAEIQVRYQACTETTCLPPATASLTAELERQPPLPALPAAGGGGRGEVQWSAVLDPGAVPSGERALLRLRAAVEAGWHLYHPLMDPENGVPVRVAELRGALRPVPGTSLAASGRVELHAEELGGTTAYTLWMPGVVEFLLPVLVDGEAGGATGEAVVHWQTCNESLCNAPEVSSLSVPVQIIPGGARAPAPVEDVPAPAGQSVRSQAQERLEEGLWAFLLAAVAAALLSLATPCVFPMIPITVSFFAKRAEGGKGTPMGNALAYGGAIVFTFVAIGLGVTAVYGAAGLNRLASSPWLNLALGLLFVLFALSLLGLYDINAPRWLQARLNAASAGGQQGAGYGPVMLMAATFSVVTFTCTVAFVGGLLALASRGAWFYALLGMTVYAVVFAAPFVLLALFPSWLQRVPRAGGWMEDIKVAMGFLEVILAFKFLSNADLFWDLKVLTRPVVIALTALPVVMWAFCLFRIFRTPHELEYCRPGRGRAVLGVLALATSAYLLNGLRGATFHGPLEAFFPPPSYGQEARGPGGDAVHAGASVVLGPADLLWFQDYREAFARAKEVGKPLFVDFTGVTCLNCRRMENNILPHAKVKPLLQEFVRAELWVDKPPFGEWNRTFQLERFNTSQQPQYVVLDPRSDGILAHYGRGYDPDPERFAAFLRQGLEGFR